MKHKQITASKVALLLQCVRPFSPELEWEEEDEDDKEAARWGSAVHEILFHFIRPEDRIIPFSEIVVKWGFEASKGSIAETHALAMWDALQAWMQPEGNPWGYTFEIESGECHLAYHLRTGEVRECDFDEETHRYGLRAGEIGGTPDLVLVAKIPNSNTPRGYVDFRVVLDYKTGVYFERVFLTAGLSDPRTPQLLTLAMMTGADAVAIMTMPEGGIPLVYSRDLPSPDVDGLHPSEIVRGIRKARGRIGDGSMTPGPECQFCPVRNTCPIQIGDALVRVEALTRTMAGKIDVLASENPGAFMAASTLMSKLISYGRDVVREIVREGKVPVENPETGKTYVLQEINVERMSKESVKKALKDPKKIEAELKRLRELGILVMAPEERLMQK